MTGGPSRPQQAKAMVLEAGVDRAGEDGDLVGARRGGGEQRLEPAGAHLDVVVDEAHERASVACRAVLRAALSPRGAAWAR